MRNGTPDRTNPWRQFRRLMLVVACVAVAAVGAAIWYMKARGVPFQLHFLLAMGGGIALSLLLAGALMGLVFVSNRSGHDDQVGHGEDGD